MVRFAGFAAADFENAADAPPESLHALAVAVQGQLKKELVRRLGDIRETLSEGASPEHPPLPQKGNNAPKGASVRLALGGEGLSVALDLLDDKSTDAFLMWMDEALALRELQNLHAFELLFLERRAENHEHRYKAKRPKWIGSGRLVERLRRGTDGVDEHTREEIYAISRSLDGRWEKAGLSLYRMRSAEDCRARGQALASDLAGDLKALAPIAGRINSLARRGENFQAPALERASWRASG